MGARAIRAPNYLDGGVIAIIHRKNYPAIHSLLDSIRYFLAIHSPSSGMLDGAVVQIIQSSVFVTLLTVT